MANGFGFMKSPAFIGAVTAAVTWYVMDEILDDHIERLLGKKKRNKGHRRKRVVRNHMGMMMPVYEDDIMEEYY